jgi:hypothetical protein
MTCKLNRWFHKGVLCLGSLLVLDGGLLQVLGNISSSVVLLSELSGRGGRAVDGLVLLCGLASRVCGTVGSILLGLETGDLLLGLVDVLHFVSLNNLEIEVGK